MFNFKIISTSVTQTLQFPKWWQWRWHFTLLPKVKVKCTLVQALRLCTGRTAHRGSRGIALLFPDRGTRRGWGVSVTPRPLFTPGKDPVPIVHEAGWAPGPVWTGAENLAPTGTRSRTVQLVTSRFTDWATRPTTLLPTIWLNNDLANIISMLLIGEPTEKEMV